MNSSTKKREVSAQQRSIHTSRKRKQQRTNPKFCFGCLPLFILIALTVSCLGIYFFIPNRTNILILGIDYTEPESTLGRSDTIILTTINTFEPSIGMLSIPRDLWVYIPGYGENRINTAHFFAEAEHKNSGPNSLIDTIRSNFDIDLDYYIRIKFDGFRELVDTLGGLNIKIEKPMAGYAPGSYHLTGRKALAFVRHRKNSDDFVRMDNGQFIIKHLINQMLNPKYWIKLPAAYNSFTNNIDTNIPIWVWPKLGLSLIRVGVDEIDNRSIDREMVTPFITNQGASVLLPDWSKINPLVLELFR